MNPIFQAPAMESAKRDDNSVLAGHASWEVGPLIGRGAVGLVYAGRQKRPERRVAIKVLREELCADETAHRRFLEEANICARLDERAPHAGIVRVLAVVEDLFSPVEVGDGTTVSRPAIVMELLHGETLAGRLERLRKNGQTMAPAEVTRILTAVLNALSWMHERADHAIVHRDIKPSNIFLCRADEQVAGEESERVVVTDFGIARVASAAALTKTGGIVGTPEYMSPEQIEGRPVDARCDLYSCGVLGFEMLAGHPPFQADSSLAVAYAHLNKTPPLLPASVPPALREAIKRALAKEPNGRFSSARAFVAALHETPARFSRKTMMIGAGAIGVAMLVGLVFVGGAPRTERVTQVQTTPALPAHRAAPGVRQELLAPGSAGREELTFLVITRWGKASRTLQNRRVVQSALAPRVRERVSREVALPQPKPQIRLTRNLPQGKQKLVKAGHPGFRRFEREQVFDGSKMVSNRETPVAWDAGQPDIVEQGKAAAPRPVQAAPRITRPREPVERPASPRIYRPTQDRTEPARRSKVERIVRVRPKPEPRVTARKREYAIPAPHKREYEIPAPR